MTYTTIVSRIWRLSSPFPTGSRGKIVKIGRAGNQVWADFDDIDISHFVLSTTNKPESLIVIVDRFNVIFPEIPGYRMNFDFKLDAGRFVDHGSHTIIIP